jgi:hypothetical protein
VSVVLPPVASPYEPKLSVVVSAAVDVEPPALVRVGVPWSLPPMDSLRVVLPVEKVELPLYPSVKGSVIVGIEGRF